ncbi:MAG TPA: cation diffusion facilitator family transporter [Candidatus Cloacimonas sp.]|nr:cation diffusion facilitator family transporter [Candidatus Cloacimonas sp.]HQO18432.1 cation diffusion facilitator family transporter [Candidatus Cloacimonas sp.]
MADRDSITRITVNLGLFSNIILSIVKTFIGIIGHSAALLADGINSTSDVVYYIAVKIFMKQAEKPADVEHPYGHRQLESISALVVGAFILTTGIAIFWESINKVYDIISKTEIGRPLSVWTLVIAIFTFCLKIFLYTYTKKNIPKTNNPTLKALADDHLNDIMAAVAVFIGVLFGRLGYYWMDPAAGAVVAIYIVKTGIEIIMESSQELMDYLPDENFVRELRTETLAVEGVRSIEDLGIHRFGPYFTVNMTITVDGSISVDKGNMISDTVEKRLLNKFSSGLRQVHIHYHPYLEIQPSPQTETDSGTKPGVSL